MTKLKYIFLMFLSLIVGSAIFALTVKGDELPIFYVKLGTGINRITPVKFANNDFKGKIKLANSFPLMEVGVGYRLTDTIRSELVFDYYFMFNSHETTRNQLDLYKIAYKTKINALMLNGYKDIITLGRFTPFIGGGIGMSTIKDKATGNVFSSEDEQEYKLIPSFGKRINRFAYKLTLGVDLQLANNATLELSYNYYNLGYNRPKIIDGMDNISRRNYLVHNVTCGIRIAF